MFMGEVLNCINFALHCISVAENAICNGLRAQSHAFPDRSRDKSVTTDMVPDDVGIFQFHCHVAEHIIAGMQSRFEVVGVSSVATSSTIREYWVTSEEDIWDYAPTKVDQVTGESLSDNIFVKSGRGVIGRKYKKCMYFEADSSFNRVDTAPEWAHKGILGPIFRAQVGETIMVHFKNKCTIETSIHPHGVFYLKDSEGAPYNDGQDNMVHFILPE